MTMFDTSLIDFEEGALNDLEKYSGVKTNDFFDDGFIRSRYELRNIGRIPETWYPYLGRCTKMDYASWLYVCTRENLLKILEISDISIPDLPIRDKYGIFEMEVY